MEEAKGLKGVVAGRTRVSTVGKGVGFRYFGYAVEELTQHCHFEQVAYLLLYRDLPDREQLADFQRKVAGFRDLSPALKQVLERLPRDSNPVDVMRTGCSALGTLEPEPGHKPEDMAIRLLGSFASILLYWHHFVTSSKRISCVTAPEDSVVLHFLKLLTQSPNHDPLVVKALDVSLILYAEHEFSTSTYVARMAASTLSDYYSCVTAAIGALRGPLHGGANEGALKLLEGFKSPSDALEKVELMRKRKQLFMGFGHRIYKGADPRAALIKDYAQQLTSKPFGQRKLFTIAEAMEGYLLREAGIAANMDLYVAITYRQCGIPAAYFPCLFVIARTPGWTAHISEQRGDNKLLKPLLRYSGPAPREVSARAKL